MDLRVVDTDKAIGSVDYANGVLTLKGAAKPVFAYLRELVGDRKLGEGLMANGWSNGYLFLAAGDGPR